MRRCLFCPPEEAGGASAPPRRKVVVADDDLGIRNLYKKELEKGGYDVLLAEDGLEAIRLTREERPAVVVLDVRMQGMDGLEVMSRILEENNELPVIINSAYCCYKESFLSWSADAYLLKSSDLSELKETIGELVAERDRVVS